MDGEQPRNVLLCKCFILCFSLSLVVWTSSLLLSAHVIKMIRTSSAHTPSAKRHLDGMCTQHRCTGPGYLAFSHQNDVGGAFRTLFHTTISSGIPTGAVISVVSELISVQAAGNQSNWGRPKTKIHYPHSPPSQTQNEVETKTTVRIALKPVSYTHLTLPTIYSV